MHEQNTPRPKKFGRTSSGTATTDSAHAMKGVFEPPLNSFTRFVALETGTR
jgi:hypothetical protein